MALTGFKAQNHRQQVAKRGARPEVDDRATSPELFAALHERFQFSIDVAALRLKRSPPIKLRGQSRTHGGRRNRPASLTARYGGRHERLP